MSRKAEVVSVPVDVLTVAMFYRWSVSGSTIVVRDLNRIGHRYELTRTPDGWRCSCPGYVAHGHTPGFQCKHLAARELRERLAAGRKEAANADGATA